MNNTTPRNVWVIGDVQGCWSALQQLKTRLDFDETQDQLWFAGDLVARGEDSLSVLREVKRLHALGAAQTVLGNHDLNLLAVWRGFGRLKTKDNTAPILQAADCDELLNWLRQQPLLHFPSEQTVLVHAGIPPQWSAGQAAYRAAEVQGVIGAGDIALLDRYLDGMYGAEPTEWKDSLSGMDRLRYITNALTRMRLCTATGQLEFQFKDDLSAPMPLGYAPWFSWEPAQPATHKILFGHWASLQGKIQRPAVSALDGGCVWGGSLMAYRVSDGQILASGQGCAKG